MLSLTELGNRLKEARQAKGMSLDDLQAVTKIQKRYLTGIEEGNYKVMPGSFYVRAFIKQYAEAVNLDPEELFQAYSQDIPSTYNDDLPDKLSRVQTRKDMGERSSKILDLLPKILIFAFVIGALVLIYYFVQKSAGDESEEPVNKDNQEITYETSEDLTKADETDETDGTDEETAEETEDTTEETEPEVPAQEIAVVEANGSKTTFELKNAEKFEVKLVSTGETWVNMKNGKGYSFFQGLLKKGGEKESETIDYSKETEAFIVVGNSLATEIYVNDQKIEYAVSPSEQVRQDITIRFVKTNE
ncbi:DUF4115 domain-containing protein [Bacillus sp. 31A1R]|uniref:DUF4115 domain-containing protein n=1 Tax=Robertmurraya mangrovi TaxID=3098077 RepID=A0ABU5J231_9BACI|nr:RodZ domain-containing protein [Bacillus sp. 31A1R]MDZ5473407.1 DUF4115 domain-containing protein [Bacillus sp. 31A1R]